MSSASASRTCVAPRLSAARRSRTRAASWASGPETTPASSRPATTRSAASASPSSAGVAVVAVLAGTAPPRRISGRPRPPGRRGSPGRRGRSRPGRAVAAGVADGVGHEEAHGRGREPRGGHGAPLQPDRDPTRQEAPQLRRRRAAEPRLDGGAVEGAGIPGDRRRGRDGSPLGSLLCGSLGGPLDRPVRDGRRPVGDDEGDPVAAHPARRAGAGGRVGGRPGPSRVTVPSAKRASTVPSPASARAGPAPAATSRSARFTSPALASWIRPSSVRARRSGRAIGAAQARIAAASQPASSPGVIAPISAPAATSRCAIARS